MFKTKIIKQISRIMVILILLLNVLSLGGCEMFEKGIKAETSTSPYIQDYMMECKSDKKTFDIDDVTLTFSYGWLGWHYWVDDEMYFTDDKKIDTGEERIPGYRLIFYNSNGKKCLIKDLQDEFISEKYWVEYISVPYKFLFITYYYGAEFIYNYSEEITIPSELFDEEQGSIGFWIFSQDDIPLADCGIYYKVDGTQVTLSNSDFRRR